MSLILNIETSTDRCSVCLSQKKDSIVALEASEKGTHITEITTLIKRLFQQSGISVHNLDAIAVSNGPGSYTGLRIGASIAKGICYALDKPLIKINTLKALAVASNAQIQGDIYCPMIDARRMEVYAALYTKDLKKIQTAQAIIINSESFTRLLNDNTIVFSGNGALKCQDVIINTNAFFLDLACHAEHLIECSYEAWVEQDFINPIYFEPLYLKKPNITKSKKVLL